MNKFRKTSFDLLQPPFVIGKSQRSLRLDTPIFQELGMKFCVRAGLPEEAIQKIRARRREREQRSSAFLLLLLLPSILHSSARLSLLLVPLDP
jgi:hypothetical protein